MLKDNSLARCTYVLIASVVVLALVIFSPVVATAGDDEMTAQTVSGNHSGFCPAFGSSSLFRSSDKVTTVNPSNWIQAIESSTDGEEILLEDGVYHLTQYTVVLNSSVTIRSASGNRNSVVIQGKGYAENAEALMVMADDVRIADLTIRDVRDHAISIKEGFAGTVIYNVNLVDIGTQHIKGNRAGPHGVIACSRIGYTEDTATGDYIGAIDLHGAIEWTIRDNYIYNIYGDGSECSVDAECGTVFPGGGPAILIWQDSRDNIIERNTIVDSFRAISLGLDTPYSGGAVRRNVVCRSKPGKEGVNGFIEGDTGISLLGASDVAVTGNRVLLAGAYPGPIELRNASGITVHNNVMSLPVWNRGNSQYNGCINQSCDDEAFGNIIMSDSVDVTCPEEGAFMVVALNAGKGEKIATAAKAADQYVESDAVPAPVTSVATASVELSQFKEEVEEVEEVEGLLSGTTAAGTQYLMAFEERLKAKEERLKVWEERLIMEERFRTIEIRHRSTQLQMNLILERLRILESRIR